MTRRLSYLDGELASLAPLRSRLDDTTVMFELAESENVGAHPRGGAAGSGRHPRWDQGCTDAARLHAEIQAQGYSGSKRSARRCLQPLRATLTAPVLPPPPPAVREVTRRITSHPDHLTSDETARLSQVKARSTQLSAAAGHVTAFAEIRQRLPHQSPQTPDVRPRQPRPAPVKGSCSADNTTQSHNHDL